MRKAIVVLGMHRSGTSALAGALIRAGARAPKTPMPATEDNPTGYWEPLPIVQLHDQWLGRAGLSWDSWDIDADILLENSLSPHDLTELRQLLLDEFLDADVFVAKDPRLCLLFNVWQKALGDLGALPCPVILLRHPIEASLSIHRRDQIDIDLAVLIWLRHNLLAEKLSRHLNRAVTLFDDLIDDSRRLLESISQRFLIDLDLTGELSVSPQLRNHSACDFSRIKNDTLRSLAAEAWQAFLNLAMDDSDSVRRQLEAIESQLDAAIRQQRSLQPDRAIIVEVRRVDHSNLTAFNIEAPLPGEKIANGRFDISGWLIPTSDWVPDFVELSDESHLLARVPINISRPDVVAAFPEPLIENGPGFRIIANVHKPSREALQLSISAVCDRPPRKVSTFAFISASPLEPIQRIAAEQP